MFDHAIFNDCMANVDFCEQMVRETNPSLLQKAESTAAPGQDVHGYKTIADIMRALNPFTGDFYLETLQVARYTREMYCLFGGRHTHPSTIMPGGVSVDITHQTCTDYYVRLMRYIDYVKRAVPMHDDLYDFFLQELPGYDMVGYRDTDLVCWGYFDDPDYVDYDYRNMTEWGRKRYITPGVVLKGELITTDLVEINLMIRILLGSSYFDDWTNEETFVTQDPARESGRQAPPVEQGDPAEAAEARLAGQVQLGRLAADLRRAQRHLCRLRHGRRSVRPLLGDGEGRARGLRLREGHRREHQDGPAEDRLEARDGARVEDPGEVQRDRARPRADVSRGVLGADRAPQPGAGADRGPGGPDEVVERLQGPAGGRLGRLLRGRPRRALAPHGDPGRQGGELPALPADALEQQPARHLRDAWPLRGCGAEHADLRGERPGEVQGRGHHAGGAELRSVPAVRRPHVQPAGWAGPEGDPHARPGCPEPRPEREECPPRDPKRSAPRP